MTAVLAASVVRELHTGWAWFVVIGNGVAGVWALAAERFAALRHRALWVLTAVVEAAIVGQAVFGVAVLSEIEGEAPDLHLFYGFVAVAAVGIIYSYRAQLARSVYLLYGLGGLFLMGMGIRAMILG